MKKKLFGTMVAIAAMFAGYSAYDAQNENELSGAVLANVEALAGCEDPVTSGFGRYSTMTCPQSDGGSYVLDGCDFDDEYRPSRCKGRAVG